MQEATAKQVFSKVDKIRRGENHVSVTGHVDERVVEDVGAGGLNGSGFCINGCSKLLITEAN